ncbi:DUF1800 domain-containing protein [Motilibacter aurantiacus]|uniref:DUF1800 domain-containing protein n=1 Tax=Motilibacter aurantiacus TaxID=2714955 RepID=UPI00140A4579|nr:DUF1800 domain-containing protein [Motilibacter aurantiacus]NHC45022.1 DUF1800 domain-containing protein [Motilibacter aurantiacus]
MTAPQALGRRALLRGALAAGTVAAVPAALSMAASAAEIAPVDVNLHLLKRATYGPTPAALDEARAMGMTAWLDAQLNPASLDDPVADELLTRWPMLSSTAAEVRAAYPNGNWAVMYALREATVARAAWSRRQLLELMVDFWANHLNVPNPSSEVWDVRHLYDRDVIRAHALGRFADMLVASAKHPAMLRYLDNANSTKNKPNENYARESLELHTVGVEAGYTEQDVKQAALLLTGFTVTGTDWTYAFVPSRHHVGPITVMGFGHPNATAAGGEAAAVEYLGYLARHPATARRIAHKLVERFVTDAPPPPLVEWLAQVYLQNDTRIAPVLRALFLTTWFVASPGQKARLPFEDVVASVRILGIGPEPTGVDGVKYLVSAANNVGQPPQGWAAPNGYPQVAGAWSSSSSTVARWNLHYSLATASQGRTLAHPARASWLPTPLPATHGELVDALCDRLLQRRSAAKRDALCAYLGVTPSTKLTATSTAATSKLQTLVAMLLDTPDFFLR